MTFPARFTSALEVVQAIRNGPSCAVLVEGEEQASDAWVLRYVLKDSLSEEVTFHGRDGRSNLLKELPDFVARLPADKVSAIVDRDFTEPAIVERTYPPDYAGHLFYWRRYCIENYLLEPAWIAEAVEEFYMHEPDRIPLSLRTAEAAEKFLLNLAQRLSPQIAGNWVIADLSRQTIQRGLTVEARQYFDDLTDRDATWVLLELSRNYGGWGGTHPDLFSAEALKTRFDNRLAIVAAKAQTLSGAHEVISGKTLLKALYIELPTGQKPGKDYLRNRLVRMASKQVPDDIRILVAERIVPRWRRAREGPVTT